MTSLFFVASNSKTNPKKLTVEIEEVKIHIF